jgi:hypothetical protein
MDLPIVDVIGGKLKTTVAGVEVSRDVVVVGSRA